MQTRDYVFREVSAGRMTVEQGMEEIEASQHRDARAARRELWLGWMFVAVIGVVLLAASWAWSSPPLEQLPDVALAQVDAAPPVPAEAPAAELASTESLVLKILGGLLGILSPLLVALVGMAVRYLNAKGKDNKVLAAFGVATELVHTYVAKAEVELRPQFQKALADGKLSAEEAAELKAKLLEILKRDMPGPVLATLSGALGPALEGWLSGKVEQAVATGPASGSP